MGLDEASMEAAVLNRRRGVCFRLIVCLHWVLEAHCLRFFLVDVSWDVADKPSPWTFFLRCESLAFQGRRSQVRLVADSAQGFDR